MKLKIQQCFNGKKKLAKKRLNPKDQEEKGKGGRDCGLPGQCSPHSLNGPYFLMQTPHTSHIIYGLFKYEQTHNRRNPGGRNPLGGGKERPENDGGGGGDKGAESHI